MSATESLQQLDSLTVLNAKTALAHGAAAIAAGQGTIDLARVKVVDSAAVAVLLAWQRAARAAGATLQILNPPENLEKLAALYGVDGLLADALHHHHH